MKRLAWLPIAAIVLLPSVACSDGDGNLDGGTTAPPSGIRGTVRGTVTVEGSPLAGVTVDLDGPRTSGLIARQSDQTAADGTYRFDDVPGGSFVVEVRDIPGDVTFPAVAEPATVVSEGQTVTVDFEGVFFRTSEITGTVTASGAPVADVTVTLSGTESRTAETDPEGRYRFSGLRAGDFIVSIAGGFDEADYTFEETERAVSVEVRESVQVDFAGEEAAAPSPTGARAGDVRAGRESLEGILSYFLARDRRDPG